MVDDSERTEVEEQQENRKKRPNERVSQVHCHVVSIQKGTDCVLGGGSSKEEMN